MEAEPFRLGAGSVLLGITVSLISIYPAVFRVWEVISFRSFRQSYSGLEERFGVGQVLVLLIIFPDAKHIVQRIERHVLDAQEDEALILRKSALEDCTMLAVAVS